MIKKIHVNTEEGKKLCGVFLLEFRKLIPAEMSLADDLVLGTFLFSFLKLEVQLGKLISYCWAYYCNTAIIEISLVASGLIKDVEKNTKSCYLTNSINLIFLFLRLSLPAVLINFPSCSVI